MGNWLRLAGPRQSLEIFGLRLVGVNAENGKKFLLSAIFLLFILVLGRALRWLARKRPGDRNSQRVTFWTRQGISLAVAVISVVGLLSIWFDDPNRLTTALGLVTAGVAFALQRVITALAGYFLILRGRTFNIGDRITMGGVRGDVIDVGFLQTTIMEMGQPESASKDPGMWVQSRQYTGRMVMVTNAKIFDEPVYNYTRKFPYIWEEMHLPIPYNSDRAKAEQILLQSARKHTTKIAELSAEALKEIEERYFVKRAELEPRVFYTLTDNWIEMALRFIVEDHGIRDIKDQMSRDILDGFKQAGIGLASGTYEIVGMPRIKVEMAASGDRDGQTQITQRIAPQ
jgi:small-conductance mechanosensitive channel